MPETVDCSTGAVVHEYIVVTAVANEPGSRRSAIVR